MRIFNYFVYIVKCSDKSYYTGVTNNVERRVYEHNNSLDDSAYTFNKRPVELVFYQPFQDIKQAITFEKQVKGWTRKKKEALIEKNWLFVLMDLHIQIIGKIERPSTPLRVTKYNN